MKKTTTLFLLMCLMSSISAFAQNGIKDTSLVFNKRSYLIQDSLDQIRIRVQNSDGKELKTVFEGIYSEEKSYERWSVSQDIGIQIPFITRKKNKRRFDMQPHLNGFGWGRIAMTNGVDINDVDGVHLDLNRSYEFNFNFIEHITPVLFRVVGVSSGIGLSWRKYYLDNSQQFVKTNNVVGIYPIVPGNDVSYSFLKTCYLTIPVMVELQMFKSSRLKPYVAAGVIGDVLLTSSSKVKYYDNGHKIKTKQTGMNILPVTMDYAVQAGMGSVSLYAKYSPFNIFEHNQGPEVQHGSVGFMIGF